MKNGVFKFHDGVKDRRVDVLRVLSDITKEISFAELENASSNDIGTISKLVITFRKALKIADFSEDDEKSLTDMEVANIANDFIASLSEVKKNTKRKRTLPNATEQVP